jgi:low affinity Fe/Cu permease
VYISGSGGYGTRVVPIHLSRLFRRLDAVSSRAAVAAVVCIGVIAFFVVGLAAGMPESWQTGFATVASAVTLVMVFAIQHTQQREQAVTQLKLDELLAALPAADDHVVKVEAGSDAEIHELRERHLQHREAIRDNR